MTTIIMWGICNVEMAHEFAKIAQRGLGENMPMIVHQHKSMENNSIRIYRLREDLQKFPSILVILENGFPLIPTVGDMVKGSRILHSQWSCHAEQLPKTRRNVKNKDLTPNSLWPLIRSPNSLYFDKKLSSRARRDVWWLCQQHDYAFIGICRVPGSSLYQYKPTYTLLHFPDSMVDRLMGKLFHMLNIAPYNLLSMSRHTNQRHTCNFLQLLLQHRYRPRHQENIRFQVPILHLMILAHNYLV